MIKEHFSLNKGERYGLFLIMLCTVLYTAYIKYDHLTYQPQLTDLSTLQDSVDSYYASQPKKETKDYKREYKKAYTKPKAKHTPKYEKKTVTKTVSVELNSANKEELLTIVGVGDFFAKSIIQERERLGGFSSKDQLKNIYGITPEKLEGILPQITIDPSLVLARVLINSTDTTELASIYGMNTHCAKRIIQYREQLGGYFCLSQLTEVYGITEEKLKTIQHRLHLDTVDTHTIDINNIAFKELMKHPYIDGYDNTKAIFRFLDYGPIESWEQFMKIPHLNVKKPERLRHYVVFNERKSKE